MSHHNPRNAFTATSLMTLSAVFFFVAQHFYSAPGATTPSESALQNDEPIAVVKSILVNGTEQLEASQSDMKVTRLSAEDEPGQAGMLLAGGDEVSTGPNAKATILFLDAAPEKDNEVLVDSNTRIRIGSIFDWFGKVLIRSKGKFDAATQKLKLDVAGTEYELVVQGDGTNRIRVLEGAVEIQKGRFSPTSRREDLDRVPEPIFADGTANFVRSSFEAQQRRARLERSPGKMEFIAVPGKTTSFDREFVFTNSCSQKHLFEIRGPRNLAWFQITGADKFAIEPRRSSSISFVIRADTTRVPIGAYEGEIIASCLDCALEPGCQIAGLLLPISVNVVAPAGTSSIPRASRSGQVEVTPIVTRRSRVQSPGPGRQVDQTATVGQKLQQVVLTPDDALVRRAASIDEIDETLNWSNDVIVAGQPTYSAQSIIPRLQSMQERSRQFRGARRGAILSNDPLSHEMLGALYVDWGNGAKAVDELRKAVSASQTAERLTSLGEAYRLTGDLRRAEIILRQAVRLYPEFAPGFNAFGNVYMDQAKIAQDKKDYESAKAALQTARNHYGRARANDVNVMPQSNLGETDLVLGDIAREEGRIADALRQYKLAEQAFSQAEGTSGSYAFATKGLGDVYRGMTKIALIQRDAVLAREAYASSEREYSQALRTHRDLAQAYVGLGNLYEDAGRKEDAIKVYRQAIRVRPEVPQAYYYYAVAIADRDPRLAAAYARAYLKLEREVFKQGEKANNARRLTGPGQLPTPTPTATPIYTLPTPTPSPTGSPVKVPDVKGNKPDEALKKLKSRGLDGRFRDQADCAANGKVLSTSPARDEKVQRGTMVTVFISAAGENAVTVPPLTNRPLKVVEQELRSLGLESRIRRRVENNSVDENTVLEQKPAANSKLKSGCTVDLEISIRVQLIEVPNYLGLSKEEAFRRLPKFSLTVMRGQVREEDSQSPPGTVIAQNPQPGEMVHPGTSVDLVFSRSQPAGVLVPDLRGMTEDQAKSYIGQMRRRLRLGQVTYKTIEYGKPANRVIQQDPPPNLTVPIGTAINLVISKPPNVIQ